MAAPAASVSCRSPAGNHSALVGGNTQSAAAVRTVSTPTAAQARWSSWVYQLNTTPVGIGKVAAVTAGIDLGNQMLEIGPGPGAATAWLPNRRSRHPG